MLKTGIEVLVLDARGLHRLIALTLARTQDGDPFVAALEELQTFEATATHIEARPFADLDGRQRIRCAWLRESIGVTDYAAEFSTKTNSDQAAVERAARDAVLKPPASCPQWPLVLLHHLEREGFHVTSAELRAAPFTVEFVEFVELA